MHPERMKEIAESLGEGFFHDMVYEVLTGSESFKKQFSGRETEYLEKAIGFMDNAIIGYRLMRKDKGVPLNRFFTEDGRNVLQIYTRVLRTLPRDVRNDIKDEETLFNTLEGFRETLVNIRDGKKVDEKKKQSLIELINNMRKETLSETSALMYQSMA